MLEVLSMRGDSKAEQINQAAKEFGYSVNSSPFNRDVLFFVFLLWRILSFKKPCAVLVRYLNDHPIFFRSLLLALNVVAVVFLCKMFKVRIIWILHNVDGETVENYPAIISFLRRVVGACSKVIFVTDPLLIPVAKEIHPQWADKIDFITFGVRTDKRDTSTDTELLAILLSLQEYRKRGGTVLFCPTSSGDKYSHIENAARLCDVAKKNNISYKVLIVGDLTSYLKSKPELKRSLEGHGDIILLNRYVTYESSKVAAFIDGYWRSLTDQSVSFTLYEAASTRKPVLTLNEGFMGVAIKEYKMGSVLESDMANFKDCHARILRWEDGFAVQFLEKHSWRVAARKINKYLSDC